MQVDNAKQLSRKLQEAGKQLVPVMEGNLVDKVWGRARPAPPSGPIRVHKLEHAGQSVQDKLGSMRQSMKGQPSTTTSPARDLLCSRDWCAVDNSA